jgi:ferric iron reductase protein FhuF
VALLHDHLVGAHLPPLVGHLNAATGRPARALWRSAGDYIGHGFAMAGWLAGDLERGRRLGEAFFALPGPVRNTMRVNRYRWGASMFPIRLRDGCCLAWRGESGQACVACPRTPEAERAARMAAVS